MAETTVISFHNGNINDEVLKYQRLVFKHFNIPLNQIKTSLSHDEAIEDYLLSVKPKNFILFDIDCIPLCYEAYSKAINKASKNILFGARQHASHIPNSRDYIAPCYMAFSFELYKSLGYPSTKITSKADCAANITYVAYERDIDIQFVEVSHCANPKWKFDNGSMFGNGTTYGNLVYHEFEMNYYNRVEQFINKCKTIVK
jgi:hypothetical protein